MKLRLMLLALIVVGGFVVGCASPEEQARELWERGRYEKLIDKFPDSPLHELACEKVAYQLLQSGKLVDVATRFPSTCAAIEATKKIAESEAESLMAIRNYEEVVLNHRDAKCLPNARDSLAAELHARGKFDELVKNFYFTPFGLMIANERAAKEFAGLSGRTSSVSVRRQLCDLLHKYPGTITADRIWEMAEGFNHFHRYEVFVKTQGGSPISDASVSYRLMDRSSFASEGTLLTDKKGVVRIACVSTRDPAYAYIDSYETSLDASVSKDSYSIGSAQLKAYEIGSIQIGKSVQSDDVVLLRDEDYFGGSFDQSENGFILCCRVRAFITMLRLEGLLGGALLSPGSISFITFKDKEYLHLEFKSATTFNTLKLDKYDVGKRLFDDIVRPALNPLNTVAEPHLFYGYDLEVIGSMKDFLDKSVRAEEVSYRFLMPQDIVRRYKDKDISGQQVLDSSVVLMDDERIELKLQ